MSELNIEQNKNSGRYKSGKRKRTRLRIRVDMTPMVDIVMLLLIFYMVTTVFNMPQAMEINLPPDEEDIIIKRSQLLDLRVDKDNHLSWNRWNPSDSLPKLIPSVNDSEYIADSDSLFSLMKLLNHQIPKLSTVIKISPEADYSMMVDILDEIDRTERAFTDDVNLGCFLSPEQFESRFSYRFAFGEWEDRDDYIAAETWVNRAKEVQTIR